jgi:hypothetical protein
MMIFDRLMGFADDDIQSVVSGLGRVRSQFLELTVIYGINPPLRICVGRGLGLIVFICVPIAGIVDNILPDTIEF